MYIYLDGVNSVAFSPSGKYLATGSLMVVNLIEMESRTIFHKYDKKNSGNS